MISPNDAAQARNNRQTAVRQKHAESIADDLKKTEAYMLFKDQNKAVLHALVLRGSQVGDLSFCPEDYRNKDSCIYFFSKHWDVIKPLAPFVSKIRNKVFFSGPLLISERDSAGYEIADGGYPRDLAKGRSKKRNLKALSKPSGIVCEPIPNMPESSPELEELPLTFDSFEPMIDQEFDNSPWETEVFDF